MDALPNGAALGKAWRPASDSESVWRRLESEIGNNASRASSCSLAWTLFSCLFFSPDVLQYGIYCCPSTLRVAVPLNNKSESYKYFSLDNPATPTQNKPPSYYRAQAVLKVHSDEQVSFIV